MNINDLTVGQVKELMSLVATSATTKPTIYQRYIGKYVIVRSRVEGINAGYVVEADETGVVLKQARRLWHHRPANKSMTWYEGVAVSGLSEDCKVSVETEEKAIIEEYSMTLCSDVAIESIREYKSYAQG